jgi:diacylglycerol kinase family enzyme
VAMTAARFVGRAEHQQLFALLAQLGALADAVTRLRENQHRAAQAAAARSAAEQLHRLAPVQRTPGDGGRAQEPVSALARETAARLVAEDSRRSGPTPPPPGVHRGRRR